MNERGCFWYKTRIAKKKMKSYHTFSNLEYTIHMITLNTPRVKIGLFWKIHGWKLLSLLSLTNSLEMFLKCYVYLAYIYIYIYIDFIRVQRCVWLTPHNASHFYNPRRDIAETRTYLTCTVNIIANVTLWHTPIWVWYS